jgi:hypothetical protein
MNPEDNKQIQEARAYTDQMIQDHVHDGNLAQAIDGSDIFDLRRYVLHRIIDSGTSNTAATSIGGDFVWPFGGQIVEVGATVDTAGVTGTMVIDINNGGTTILSTKINIDTTEKTSRTAATAEVVSNAVFAEGDIYTFDVDTIQTTAAKGLTIFFSVLVTTQ